MYDVDGPLGPSVIRFVEGHVSSLLTWDILVYFYRNPEARLDARALAEQLGRRQEEVGPEVTALCAGDVLACDDGIIRYAPSSQIEPDVAEFIEACQDRGRRLALIALVLHRIGKRPGE